MRAEGPSRLELAGLMKAVGPVLGLCLRELLDLFNLLEFRCRLPGMPIPYIGVPIPVVGVSIPAVGIPIPVRQRSGKRAHHMRVWVVSVASAGRVVVGLAKQNDLWCKTFGRMGVLKVAVH